MKKLLLTGLAVALVALSAAPVQAIGHRRGCRSSCGDCAPACGAACASTCASECATTTVVWEERTVTAYRSEWRERDVTYTVNRLVPREVVNKSTVVEMVPNFTEEKRTITVMTCVPRVVERDVTCCRTVPVQCVDPCSGCCYTSCQRVMEVQRVQQTVMESVPVSRDIMVRVCNYKRVERPVETRYTVYDTKPEQVKGKERYCVTVPYTTTVKVAVCVPVATCAPVATCCP